jgi:hypothetical protein
MVTEIRAFDPFLLPVCDRCGGATMLASSVPPISGNVREERTYRCMACGSEHMEAVRKAGRGTGRT